VLAEQDDENIIDSELSEDMRLLPLFCTYFPHECIFVHHGNWRVPQTNMALGASHSSPWGAKQQHFNFIVKKKL